MIDRALYKIRSGNEGMQAHMHGHTLKCTVHTLGYVYTPDESGFPFRLRWYTVRGELVTPLLRIILACTRPGVRVRVLLGLALGRNGLLLALVGAVPVGAGLRFHTCS